MRPSDPELRYQHIFWPNTSLSRRTTRSEIRCPVTCANPELIDAGSVATPLVSGTDSYGSVSEAKRSRSAVSTDFFAEHVPIPANHTIRNQVSKDLRGGRKAWLPAGAGPAGLSRALRANLCASALAFSLLFLFLLFFLCSPLFLPARPSVPPFTPCCIAITLYEGECEQLSMLPFLLRSEVRRASVAHAHETCSPRPHDLSVCRSPPEESS